MSVFYAHIQAAHLQDLIYFCGQFGAEIQTLTDSIIRFKAEGEQRLSLHLNLEAIQSDLGCKVHMVEGIDHPTLMIEALGIAQSHLAQGISCLKDIFVIALRQGDQNWLSAAYGLLGGVPEEVLKTADMLALAQGNALLAAQQLYLHRNTFNYRLKKFESKTKLDLRDPNIMVFYQLMRTFTE